MGKLLAIAELPLSQWSVELFCRLLAKFLLPCAVISCDVREYYPVIMQVNSSLPVKLMTLLCALRRSLHFTTVQTTDRELLCFVPQMTVLTHNILVHRVKTRIGKYNFRTLYQRFRMAQLSKFMG